MVIIITIILHSHIINDGNVHTLAVTQLTTSRKGKIYWVQYVVLSICKLKLP